MNSDGSDWFMPEALEIASRSAESKEPGQSGSGDFDSYARANRGEGLATSFVESHNLTKPHKRVALYRAVTKKVNIRKIADLGCGLGFTTAELSVAYRTNDVTGFDVSTDACQFAQKHWPWLSFISGALTPIAPLPQQYDLILAQEFYPFTRTADYAFQLQFIEMLVNALTPTGALLVVVTESAPLSILCNEQQIVNALIELGFSTKRVVHFCFVFLQ
jgi:SAM-dependent methyltransferase